MAFHDKELTVPGTVEVADRHVKRYHIDRPDRCLEPEVVEAAYAYLPKLLPGTDGGIPPASWMVLHRGGDSGANLLAYSWFWDNVLECRIAVAGQPVGR
ncbi:hypothetical protein [Dactylosporangium sp. NPDC050588]|uniref:hypothetical protein n=1 Tax=Dactylosporangium sp. NPDC050588 TaxID=3157211 RepID=UPI0033D0A6D2